MSLLHTFMNSPKTLKLTIPKTLRGPNGFKASVLNHGVDSTGHEPLYVVTLRDKAGKDYRLRFDAREVDDSTLKKALLFFRHDPLWRQHTECPLPPDTWRLASSVSPYEYDPQVADLFASLQAMGYPVMHYNKGAQHPNEGQCHLAIGAPWPTEIEQVMLNNGWASQAGTLTIRSIHGHGQLCHQALILLLDDWVHGAVDASGLRYQTQRDPEPWLPKMGHYPHTALLERLEINQIKAEKLNRFNGPASFDDYAKLTSGRDTLSSLNLDQLIKKLGKDPILAMLTDHADNPTILAKALRWRIRGLSLVHTREKHDVDIILHNFAEQERYKKRIERYGESAIAPV